MITINLLPEELRLKEAKQIHIPYQKIAFGVFLIVFVITVYNLIVYLRVRSEYGALQKQWNQMAKKSSQADALESELGSSIIAEVDFYDSWVDPPLATARILNLISDFIPKSVWLTEISFNRNKKNLDLVIIGLSQSGGGTSKLIDIQNFTNTLKSEMEKFTAKSRLKVAITTSSKKTSENTDLTQFTANFATEGVGKK